MVMSGNSLHIFQIFKIAHQVVVVVLLVLDILVVRQLFIIQIFSFLVKHQEVKLKVLEKFFPVVGEEVDLLLVHQLVDYLRLEGVKLLVHQVTIPLSM